jgi:7,8-dihydropterin-6-yl-methyl-4-(beta-D-ribofuranosyl)aminobenzene 5'-phosphate synthase
MALENIGELDSLKITVLAEDSCRYETPYLAQHGISLLLEATGGNVSKHILVDVGQHPEPLLHNMRLLGFRPEQIDAVVLTHCHYDHTRGVSRVLREIGKANVPVIVHPDIFRPHFVTEPEHRNIGMRDGDLKADIERAGGKITPVKDPLVIRPGLFTSGEVTRQTDFEKPPPQLKTISGDRVIADSMIDDQSLFANIWGKGIVVITGCAHAGIVNICRQALRLTDKPVWGIVGGLHLIDAPADIIQRTAKELAAMNVGWISAGHCTGFPAQVEFYQTLGERFSPLQTGMLLEL